MIFSHHIFPSSCVTSLTVNSVALLPMLQWMHFESSRLSLLNINHTLMRIRWCPSTGITSIKAPLLRSWIMILHNEILRILCHGRHEENTTNTGREPAIYRAGCQITQAFAVFLTWNIILAYMDWYGVFGFNSIQQNLHFVYPSFPSFLWSIQPRFIVCDNVLSSLVG